MPYDYAFNYLKEAILFNGLPVELWVRNSVRQGNYRFGLSDLDLTVYSDAMNETQFKKLKHLLTEAKKLFPFLGETNVYISPLAENLIQSANIHEIGRDPELLSRMPKVKDHPVDKTVFLLRMLYSDKTNLLQRPELRKSKWIMHLQGTDFEEHHGFGFDSVVSYLNSIIGVHGVDEALQYLKGDVSEPSVFLDEKPKLWKYLFPHKHLWFETAVPDSPEEVRGTILADICLRQIDWEVWGLMTQLPFIPDRQLGFKVHLNRLARVASEIDPDSKVASRINYLIQHSDFLKLCKENETLERF